MCSRIGIVIALLIFSNPLFAQVREGAPYSGKTQIHPFMEMTGQRADGYKAGYLGTGGIEIWQKHMTSAFRVTLDTSDKPIEKSGTTFRFLGNSYFNVKPHFFAGGGGEWVKTITGHWSKQNFFPLVGGGFGSDLITAKADWFFSGTDKQNGVRGLKTEAMIPLDNSSNGAIHSMYLVTRIGRFTAYATNCPSCERIAIYSTEMGFLLKW
ncbi:MAG: hypothetical protein ACM3JB_10835 [Acidobacteriaceae bacterium]